VDLEDVGDILRNYVNHLISDVESHPGRLEYSTNDYSRLGFDAV